MNYLNEYNQMRNQFLAKPRYRNSTFPPYNMWIKSYIQANILDSEISYQSLIQNSMTRSQLGNDNKDIKKFLNHKKHQKSKLSTKERLRKKLEEKKQLSQ